MCFVIVDNIKSYMNQDIFTSLMDAKPRSLRVENDIIYRLTSTKLELDLLHILNAYHQETFKTGIE